MVEHLDKKFDPRFMPNETYTPEDFLFRLQILLEMNPNNKTLKDQVSPNIEWVKKYLGQNVKIGWEEKGKLTVPFVNHGAVRLP